MTDFKIDAASLVPCIHRWYLRTNDAWVLLGISLKSVAPVAFFEFSSHKLQDFSRHFLAAHQLVCVSRLVVFLNSPFLFAAEKPPNKVSTADWL